MKMRQIFHKNFTERVVIHLIIPRNMKLLNVPLLGELWVGEVGQNAANIPGFGLYRTRGHHS